MKRVFITSLLAGCMPDAPASPSFQQHVLPILAANCVRCHGYPAIGGAPALARFDSYAEVAIDDTTRVLGAGVFATAIADRVVDDERPMPPRFPLDDGQIATLQNWAAGAPAGEAPPRGEPRDGNRLPEIIASRIAQDGSTLVIESRVVDADGDLVAGELRVQIGARERIVGPVRSGLVELRWDAAEVAPGSYPLSARIDDGADAIFVSLGTLDVGGAP